MQLGVLLLFLSSIVRIHAADSLAAPPSDSAPAGVPLRLLNREIFVFRGTLGPYHPAQRAAAAAALIEDSQTGSGDPRVSSSVAGTNAEIRVHGQTVFFVTPRDVYEIQGETFETLVSRTVERLDRVLSEMEEMRDHRSLVFAILKAILATVLFAGITWVLSSNRRRAEGWLIRFTAEGAQQLKSHTLRVLGLQNLVSILRGGMTLFFWSGAIVTGYIWLQYMLRLFPHTRPFGELLGFRFLEVLGQFGQGALHQLPNLGIVLLVWALARFAVTATRRFFTAVAQGKVRSQVFDAATAPMTQRLVIFVIWITAVIVAFPYIPGSQTPAFRGISVLAGLMISLGSGSLIGQLVGGLVVVYNRNCRAGEYVRVGEYEGTLVQIGFFSSRLVNVRNEEIVVPNSQLASGVLINFSRRGSSAGVALPVKVSIGYGTPWRLVHSLLIVAARRTKGIRPSPAPTVLQLNLADFYVEYQLNALLEDPTERVTVLSELNANIQDAFNEAGVQIMSPHYRTDPPHPVYVPKDRWHEPPGNTPEAGRTELQQ